VRNGADTCLRGIYYAILGKSKKYFLLQLEGGHGNHKGTQERIEQSDNRPHHERNGAASHCQVSEKGGREPDKTCSGPAITSSRLSFRLRQDGLEAAREKSHWGVHFRIFRAAALPARDCRIYVCALALLCWFQLLSRVAD
jgi:hypothetical protein